MPTFERGDVVAVPFPYVERPVTESRPALVVSAPIGPQGALLWVLMITTAGGRWPGDVEIVTSHGTSGLRMASVVRTAKIATIEAQAARRVGRLDRADLQQVDAALGVALGQT